MRQSYRILVAVLLAVIAISCGSDPENYSPEYNKQIYHAPISKDSIPIKKEEYVKHYYSNGNLKSEGRIKNGKKNGYWKYYQDNGQLAEQGNFMDDKKDGWWEEYLGNGNTCCIGNYQMDKKMGYWRYYHSNTYSTYWNIYITKYG